MKPITFLFDYEHTNDKMRPYVMQEFVKNGAPYQVLTDTLISEIAKSPSFAKTLKKNAQDTGVTFVDSHAPFGPWEDLDVPVPEARPIMLERLRLAMRIAADFGIDTMTIHVGNAPEPFVGYTLPQFHQAIIDSLEALLPLAEKLNMVICIENIWFATNTPEKLLDILGHFKTDYLGICYDAGHANLMARDRGFTESAAIKSFSRWGCDVPYDDHILEKLLPHVVNCHLHDNNGQYDQHVLPGMGDVDWPHIIGLLKTAPRIRSFQSEVIPVRAMASILDVVTTFNKLFA